MSEVDDYARHINQLERDRQSQDAQLKQAKVERSAERWAAFKYIGIAAVVVAGIVYAIFLIIESNEGYSDGEKVQIENRKACMAAGGTWAYVDAAEPTSLCVMSGRSTP